MIELKHEHRMFSQNNMASHKKKNEERNMLPKENCNLLFKALEGQEH
jgi:hypothetical protein